MSGCNTVEDKWVDAQFDVTFGLRWAEVLKLTPTAKSELRMEPTEARGQRVEGVEGGAAAAEW